MSIEYKPVLRGAQRSDFAAGDRVRRLYDGDIVRAGTPGTVVDNSDPNWRTVLFDNGVEITVDRTDLTSNVDEFPIAADRDPWRESEPRERVADACGSERHSPNGRASCNRRRHHIGHHVARGSEDCVFFRWPQEPAPKPGLTSAELVNAMAPEMVAEFEKRFGNKGGERPGQRVGDEVVFAREYHETGKPRVVAGVRGRVVATVVYQFDVAVDYHGGVSETFHMRPLDFGTTIVPAAEWDAQHKSAPLQYGKLNLADSYDGAPLSPGKVHQVGPDGNLRWVDPTALSGDLGGPTPKYEFTEAFVAKLARALHDYDMEPVALRLEDRCDARHDKAAVLDRMWRDRTTPEKKAEYAWVAAILLRRTKELP